MKLGDTVDYTLRPDAQAFDEIRIRTIPRYKTSGLSGDEWRIHAEIEFYRKGVLRHSTALRNVETACGFLYAEHAKACDDGKAYFAGDGVHCDQEGCATLAMVTYRMKKKFCREGHGTEPHWETRRRFCDEHKQRGDCGLDDADSNYELVELSQADPAVVAHV